MVHNTQNRPLNYRGMGLSLILQERGGYSYDQKIPPKRDLVYKNMLNMVVQRSQKGSNQNSETAKE